VAAEWEVSILEVKVKLRSITIKDENTGELFTVRTIRSAKEIAGYVEESEKDEVVSKLEQEVWKVINKDHR
jgi:hypothetical protein